MMASSILTLGRHTVSGMIAAAGRQFSDWSAAYRLFERERIDTDCLFAPALDEAIRLQGGDCVYAVMDDTMIRKTGKNVSGTSWRRDALGPPFTTNIVWGQRFLQVSVAVPDFNGSGRARAIPVGLTHAPTPRKPKKTALPEVWQAYRTELFRTKVSSLGARQLKVLRKNVKDKKIVVAVDGGFTNRTVFSDIPENTTLIGRIRKDARLFAPPEQTTAPARGRKRIYGEALPTPDQIRQDDSIPWQTVEAFAAGRRHDFDVKVISPVRWKGLGDKDAMVVIIRPLAYRKSKGARLMYRQPAYLICTDITLALEDLVQAYLWRWEIELNFRDEKTVFGVGEAQVRTPASVESVPALIVASYAFLLLAGISSEANSTVLPSPKWARKKPCDRCSTQQFVAQYRAQLWGIGMESIFRGFVSSPLSTRSPFNCPGQQNLLHSAVCYATK